MASDWNVQLVPKEDEPGSLILQVANKFDSTQYFSAPRPLSFTRGTLYHLNETKWMRLKEITSFRDDDTIVVTYPKCGVSFFIIFLLFPFVPTFFILH